MIRVERHTTRSRRLFSGTDVRTKTLIVKVFGQGAEGLGGVSGKGRGGRNHGRRQEKGRVGNGR
jgi:hypothetical protein